MKRFATLVLAAIVLVTGYTTYSYAKEPTIGTREDKTVLERNRHGRRRGGRHGGGGVWFGFGGGGYHPRPYRHYYGRPRTYYYGPQYYYAPQPYYYVPQPQYVVPQQQYYYAPAPGCSGGTVIVR